MKIIAQGFAPTRKAWPISQFAEENKFILAEERSFLRKVVA